MAADRKILIVEDEKKIADHLVTSLRWDLIILDINLPGMNGYDLCKVIRHRYPEMLVAVSHGKNSKISFNPFIVLKKGIRYQASDWVFPYPAASSSYTKAGSHWTLLPVRARSCM